MWHTSYTRGRVTLFIQYNCISSKLTERERERGRERGSVCVCVCWFAKQSSTIHEFSSTASQVHAYIYAYIHMYKVFAYIYIYIYIYCMTTSMISCTNSQRAHTFKCIHMWMPRKLYVHSWCGPSIKIICNSYIHIGQIVTLPCGVSKRKIISHTCLIWGIHTHTHTPNMYRPICRPRKSRASFYESSKCPNLSITCMCYIDMYRFRETFTFKGQ